MKKKDVRIGESYLAKVSGDLVPVQVLSETSTGYPHYRAAFRVVNTRTGQMLSKPRTAAALRPLRRSSSQRSRRAPAPPSALGPRPPVRFGGVDVSDLTDALFYEEGNPPFFHEEMGRLTQRACGNCETIDCVGECVLGELRGELQSHIEGTHEPPPWAATEKDRRNAIRDLKKEIARIEKGLDRGGNPPFFHDYMPEAPPPDEHEDLYRLWSGVEAPYMRNPFAASPLARASHRYAQRAVESDVLEVLQRHGRSPSGHILGGIHALGGASRLGASRLAVNAKDVRNALTRLRRRGLVTSRRFQRIKTTYWSYAGSPESHAQHRAETEAARSATAFEVKRSRSRQQRGKNPFRSRLSGGKVPVGSWTFDYYPHPPSAAKLGFLARSAQARQGMDAERKKDHVVITGSAAQHRSLVTSLQGLEWPGEVVEHKLNPSRSAPPAWLHPPLEDLAIRALRQMKQKLQDELSYTVDYSRSGRGEKTSLRKTITAINAELRRRGVSVRGRGSQGIRRRRRSNPHLAIVG